MGWRHMVAVRSESRGWIPKIDSLFCLVLNGVWEVREGEKVRVPTQPLSAHNRSSESVYGPECI